MKKKMTKDGRLTLAAFKKKHGPTQAAALLGVTTVTLWRWETKKTAPEGNDLARVRKLGIVLA